MRLLLLGGETPSTPLLMDAAVALGADPRIEGEVNDRTRGEGACAVVDLDGDRVEDPLEAVREAAAERVPVVAVGTKLDTDRIFALFEAGARDVLLAPLHKRELMLRLSALLNGKPRIACIGGGTGLYTVLSGLREAPRLLLSSIVTMSDDGGSSGRLRASFGVLPPGDVRRSLVALSNAPEVMSYVMQYRFEHGEGLTGHSLGNLLLTALAELGGGMQGAVKALGDVLNVQGLVMCVTTQEATLCAEFEDGRSVRGESAIDLCLERPAGLRVRRVWHEPPAATTPDV
ncbi:MAG TPA: 2-phospho-L-lactate transferase CofD family protein, partial [Polyangiaceae bacterium]